MKRFLSLLMVVAALATLLPLAAQATTRFVDAAATGANNGGTWGDAYTSLDAALTASTGGDSIYVAKGTYVPATTFTMKSGVAVYGGFPIGGGEFSARNWKDNVTILSGDVSGNDTPGNFYVNRTDNRATVVTFSGVGASGGSDSLLDGFKVRGAYNDTGIRIASSTLIVSNCWVTDNIGAAATQGGGVSFSYGTTATGTFVNCIVSTNLIPYDGGGFCLDYAGYSKIYLINCTVWGNARTNTSRRGGGIYANSRFFTLHMTNTIVYGNTHSAGTRCNMYYRGGNTIKSAYSFYTIDASGSTTHTAGTGDNRTDDPLLSDPGVGDFHLGSGSLAKYGGIPDPRVPQDYDRVARHATTPSVGALEYVASGDLVPPADVTGVGIAAGHKLLTLSWSNPGDTDFNGVLILRKLGSAPTGAPSDGGGPYTINQAIGDGTVVYTNTGTSCTDTGLLLGSNYFYKLWTYDTSKNYSDAPAQIDGIPVADLVAPNPVTDFTTAEQSDSAIKLDWVNSSSSDSLGVLILRKAGGVPTGVPGNTNVYVAGNTIGDGTVVYVGIGSSATPGGASTWTDSNLTHELTAYGYSIFAYDIAPNYSDRTDGSDTTLGDSIAPADVTAQSATGDDAEVLLRWTNPSDIDIQGVLILRSTAGTPAGVPVAGTTYTAGETIGSDDVVFVGGSAAPGGMSAWSDQGLVNSTHYYYKIFARDEHPNFAGGVAADATPAGPASIKYVDGTVGAEGDGSTWGTAFKTLTNALFNATSGDELWVAAGTYKPADVGGTTASRFEMKTNVKLYGGFTGTMSHRYERNWVSHPTILSGDLGGDDTANWGNRTDNASNVVWAANSITGFVLDGFKVQAGDKALLGAGMYLGQGAAGVVANCYFTDNRASITAGYGGGMSPYFTGAVRVENCVFYANRAYRGGGLASYPVNGSGLSCDFTLLNCTIYGNTIAENRGAGTYIQYIAVAPSWYFKNCIVYGNTSDGSGAIDLHVRETRVRIENSCYGLSVDGAITYDVNSNNKTNINPLVSSVDLRLTPESPCIDTGTGTGAPVKDYALTLRPQGAGYDMGAYEYMAGGDVTPPADVSGVSITAGHQFLSPAWTNPGDADFNGVLVVRKLGSALVGAPSDGTGYLIGATVGDGTVVSTNTGTGFTDSGLLNGSNYYYKFFAYDATMNYAAGVEANSAPVADTTPPEPVTSLAAAAQSDTAIKLDWVNSSSGDSLGVIILRRTGGVPTGSPTASTTYTVGTAVGNGTVVYVGAGSSGTPGAASTWTDSSPTLELTTYGYSVFARDIVPNYSTRADDSDVTLGDSLAPGNVTAQTATGDDGEVALAWTHPSDTDVQGVLVLRSTSGTPSGTPSVGTAYTAGQSVGDGTVVYVSSGATPSGVGAWSDLGLNNGTHYYYKIFAFDEHPNYASGGAAADATPTGPGSVKYVNGAMGAEGNGSTWTTAFKTLTNALFNAGSGDELWVATGTYTPAGVGGITSNRFTMKSGVKLYGGFTSGMSHRYERSWTNHVTTLSGDLNGNDSASWGNRSDNATNVLYASLVTGVVVDGFTVKGGYSTGTAGYGAGMYVNASTVTVANCVVTDNRAGYGGGGIYLAQSQATIERTRFISNATVQLGGGVYASASGTPVTGAIRNCVFDGNRNEGSADNKSDGGGLMLQDAAYSVESCTFYNNYTGRRGGGVKFGQQGVTAAQGGTPFVLKNCILWGNQTGTPGSGGNLAFQQANNGMSVDVRNCVWSGVADFYDYYGNGTFTAMIEGDPLFFNAAAGDFRLNCGSPAIDAGTGSGAPATDINGDTRPEGSGIDIGAYENTVYTVTVNPAAGAAGATVTFNGQAYSASTVVPVEAGSYTASYTSPQAEGASTRYVFSAWTLDGNDAGSSPATIVVGSSSGNRVLNVTFTKQFKLALTVVGGAYGTVSGGTDGGWYYSGSVLQLDSHPLPRATFVGWSGDCIGGEVTMNGAKSVTATFDSTDPTFIMFQ